MKTLEPIRINNQIEDCLFGKSSNIDAELNNKINTLKDNINNIIKINGSKVFNVVIKDKDIYYNLRNNPNYQKYYYPIQYAKIEFK